MICAIIDVETTGLDPATDAVTEVGVVLLHWTDDGQWWTSTTFGAFVDPGRDIPLEAQRLTGIRPEMVAGAKDPWPFVRRLIERADYVAAHNAPFDRSFLERVIGPVGRPWLDTQRHLPWKDIGAPSLGLVTVAATVGRFCHPVQHRAVADCQTVAELIGPRMDALVTRALAPEVEVSAHGAPFDAKDALKARGYDWDAPARVWRRVIVAAEFDAEQAWLAAEVYRGVSRASVREVSK